MGRELEQDLREMIFRVDTDELNSPIHLSAPGRFKNSREVREYAEGGFYKANEYGRYGNATIQATEAILAHLDNAQHSVLVPSGMAAITLPLSELTKVGDHVVVGSDCYRRTRQFIHKQLGSNGVKATEVDVSNPQALREAITPETKIIFIESPSNPYLKVVDLVELERIRKEFDQEIITIIDSTIATPYNQKPLQYGVDLVVHSATKYLSGHNNIIAGSVSGNGELIKKIQGARGIYGDTPDSRAAHDLMRSLETFYMRMKQHNTNGMAIARMLEDHSKVEQVWYPGLESHPDYAVAQDQMRGYGGLITFKYAGNLEETEDFIDRIAAIDIDGSTDRLSASDRIVDKPFTISPSLGGTRSLVELPLTISYYDSPPALRKKIGITENLVRMSVGIESTDYLLNFLSDNLYKN